MGGTGGVEIAGKRDPKRERFFFHRVRVYELPERSLKI